MLCTQKGAGDHRDFFSLAWDWQVEGDCDLGFCDSSWRELLMMSKDTLYFQHNLAFQGS